MQESVSIYVRGHKDKILQVHNNQSNLIKTASKVGHHSPKIRLKSQFSFIQFYLYTSYFYVSAKFQNITASFRSSASA